MPIFNLLISFLAFRQAHCILSRAHGTAERKLGGPDDRIVLLLIFRIVILSHLMVFAGRMRVVFRKFRVFCSSLSLHRVNFTCFVSTFCLKWPNLYFACAVIINNLNDT